MATEVPAHDLAKTRFCTASGCDREVGPGEERCCEHRRDRPPARLLADPLGLDVESLTGGWEGWAAVLDQVATIGLAAAFWLGDLLCDPRWQDDEKYARAAAATGEKIERLYHFAWVARSVVRENRRRISWSHHRAVARLPRAEQATWLERAIDERMTVAELSRALGDDADVGDGGDVVVVAARVRRLAPHTLRGPDGLALLRLEIRAPAEHIELWQQRAGERGLSLTALATQLLRAELGTP
jgi:hypothetical protein